MFIFVLGVRHLCWVSDTAYASVSHNPAICDQKVCMHPHGITVLSKRSKTHSLTHEKGWETASIVARTPLFAHTATPRRAAAGFRMVSRFV